jgi:ribosomal protein S12 methylthiotransferase
VLILKKIAVISLGCPKNLVDSEMIIGSLNERFEVIGEVNEADYILVNTCGFIESAKQESIDSIIDAYKNKKREDVKVIVTGCLAKRYKEEIENHMPEVNAVVGIGDMDGIFKIIDEEYFDDKTEKTFKYQKRLISTTAGYAYLKISDGCDNRCTYCAIPDIRGPYKSREFEEIIDEAKLLSSKGVKELVIVAQDTTYYGLDLYGKRRLAELISKIAEIKEIKWIRLMYAYPEQIDNDLILEYENNAKLCKYIDMPLQHISQNILKAMGRRGTEKEVRAIIKELRERVPEIIIRTTFIVGFPGETEDDFEILYNFVKETKFERIGVFTYSKEDGTPAAKMKNQIPKKIKQTRHDKIMQLQQGISEDINKTRLNKIFDVIVEGVSDDGLFYVGRTYGEAPDIDVKIYFTSEEPLKQGDFVPVKILNTEEYDLIGAVVYEAEFT